MLRASVIARMWVGTLVFVVLGGLWLQVPDSHLWEVVFSILFACGFLALLFWFYGEFLGRMLKLVREERWWLRWILLAAVIVVWWLLQMSIDKCFEHRELYAGYWTSRIPHFLRGLRTYEHLVLLQDWLYLSMRLIVTGLLLPVAVVAAISRLRENTKRILTAWSRWWYWVAVLACGWMAYVVSDRLLHWIPKHGLEIEIWSLLMRLGLVYTLDTLLACFVLAVVVTALQRDTASSLNNR